MHSNKIITVVIIINGNKTHFKRSKLSLKLAEGKNHQETIKEIERNNKNNGRFLRGKDRKIKKNAKLKREM